MTMVKGYAKAIAAVLAVLLILPTGAGAGKASASAADAAREVVIEHLFEDGALGWYKRGSETVTHSLHAAYEGSGSLLTEGRTATWNGPGFNLAATGLLHKEAVYEISAYVKLKEGAESEESLQFAVKQTGADNEYVNLGSAVSVGDENWVLVKGQYTYDKKATVLEVYLQSTSSATAAYYMDQFVVEQIQAAPEDPGEEPPSGETIIYDFEDGTTMGWAARGEESVSVSEEVAHSGSRSLKAYNRTATWNGPSRDVKELLQPDTTYRISAFVRLESVPTAPSTIRLTMENKAEGASQTAYTSLASASVGATDWVELKGTFSYAGARDTLRLYIESSNVEDQLYIDDVVIAPPGTIQTDIPSLGDVYSDYFEIGAAVEPVHLNGVHKQLLEYHYNSIVAENAMKPSSINPSPGVFNWTGADQIRDYARDNDMNLRFHTLVWHEQGADWMLKDENGIELEATPENKELVLQRLETYLREVVGRYKDDVRDWDVVNEVIDENRPDGMRNSAWYRLTGLDFIRTAFEVTREVAGDDAKLYINDYGTHQPRKRDFLYDLAVGLRNEGVPIDGVGHQTHINIASPSIGLISDSIRKFGEAGFDNQLTELDISVYTNNTDAYTVVPEGVLADQGYRYKELFQELRSLDLEGKAAGAENGWISNVTLWGIADDHTWLHNRPIARQDAPFPFDKNYRAKPAYWGMVNPAMLPLSPQTARSTQGTPSSIGVNDPAWGPVPYVKSEDSNELQISFKTLWDSGRLYVQAEVNDGTLAQGDKVELFLYDGGTGSHLELSRGGAGSTETAGGYRVEGALPLATPGAPGGQVLFDIRATDTGTDGSPENTGGGGIVSWSDHRNNQHADRLGYGTLTFVDGITLGQAFKGTPVIDGEPDAIWQTAPEMETGIWVQGTEGSTAKFRALWDESHLYIYAVVTDSLLTDRSSNPWEQDSIEIFVDQNNGKTSEYEGDDGQYRINFRNARSVGGFASLENLASEVKIIKDASGAEIGYVVEAAIKLPAIAPSEGLHIGFDLQVNNDVNDDGTRDSVAIWADESGQSYADTSRLGVLRLSRHPASPPSGAGSFYIPPVTEIKNGVIFAPVTLLQGTAKANVTEQQLREVLRQAQKEGSDVTAIGIELKEVSGGTAYELGLPAVALEGAETIALDIATPIGRLKLSGKLLSDASAEGLPGVTVLLSDNTLRQSAGVTVLLLDNTLRQSTGGSEEESGSSQQADSKSLNDAAEWLASVGNRPVIKVSLLTGGDVWNYALVNATVVIPYKAAQEEAESLHRLVVLRVNNDGTASPVVNSRYIEEEGGLVFQASLPGTFAIANAQPNAEIEPIAEWAREAAEALLARGIAGSFSGDTLHASSDMNRGDFTRMLVDVLELSGISAKVEGFDDVASSDSRYEALRIAKELGIATGVGGNSFNPDSKLSRQDMFVLASRALSAAGKLSGNGVLEDAAELEAYSDHVQVAKYARESTALLLSLGVLNGMDGKLAPLRQVSAGQAAVLLYRIWQMS
ncbi:endo-1,4-beta-xylanase [Paenibacillus sp. CAU 1782]